MGTTLQRPISQEDLEDYDFESGEDSQHRVSLSKDHDEREINSIHDIIVVRQAWPSDKNFIYSTWLKGLYYGNTWFRQIPKNLYFDTYKKIVEKILDRPSVYINAACLIEDPEILVSYAVLERKDDKEIIHWVFTKQAWRKMGIAKQLIPNNINECSHLTSVGKSIKPRKWIFNPFLF